MKSKPMPTNDEILLRRTKMAEMGFVVQQTYKTRELTGLRAEWHQSWLDVGFPTKVSNDEDMLADVAYLSEFTGNPDFIETYNQLFDIVQKSDFWRYAKLYLEGGLYADVDIIAHPGMYDLVMDFLHSNDEMIAFWESYQYLGWFGLYFHLDSMVRYPQYRQCIMVVKTPMHPVYLRALENIVDQMKTKRYLRFSGLARTLELTGPGVYTDAVNYYFSQEGKPGLLMTKYRSEAPQYFEHVGTGVWKIEKHLGTTERISIFFFFLLWVGFVGGLCWYRLKRWKMKNKKNKVFAK